jgi:GNAT superfamily N-acetyltransferase
MAELDGEPAGYAVLTPAYETRQAARGFELNELYVTEAARQRSIWPVLLSVAANETKRRDGKFLRWVTHAWNVPAQEFYRKQGASELPVMSHALSDKKLDAAAADGAAFLKRISKP